MPALNLIYRKTTYRLVYERELFAGAYMIEAPLLINENLAERSIDPQTMECPGFFKYHIMKFDHAALLTVKGPGIYLQLILTDLLCLSDFNTLCNHLYRDVCIKQLTTAYVFATLERTLRTTIRMSEYALLQAFLWTN